MSEWISVKDQMPTQNDVVDVWCLWPSTNLGSRMADVSYRVDAIGPYWYGFVGHIENSVITHWMPKPEPPPLDTEQKEGKG